VRRFSTEFEGYFFVRSAHRALNEFPDSSTSGKGHFVDVVVVDQRGSGFSCSGDDVDDAFRKSGFLENLGEFKCCERARFGWFKHDGIPSSQCRSDFPRGHQQREVPRNNLSGYSERFRLAVRKRVIEFIGTAGVVEKVIGRNRYI